MPEELRQRLHEAAAASGRSLNREIVERLEGSLADRRLPETPMRGRHIVRNLTKRRTIAVLAVTAAALLAVGAGLVASGRSHPASPTSVLIAQKQLRLETQGTDRASGGGGESNEYATGQQQFQNARTAPTGIVNPGAYGAAATALNTLPSVGGTWADITAVKYDSDHPAYRDFASNSGGGNGLVTGRITGLATDGAGDIWAAGADGGVWRRDAGSNAWTAISDGLLSLSSGDLEYSNGVLWYATGEANTGAESYVGAGVYVLTNPTSNTSWTRVGGNELESTTIGRLRFDKTGSRVWAATLRGVWWHTTTAFTGPWTLAFAANPGNLPTALQAYTVPGSQLAQATFGTNTSSTTQAPYKNIVNDVAVVPNNANHVIAAVGWRSGDIYNGFYETTDGGLHWAKVNPTGALPASDVGYVTFAFAADGSKLYAINQSPTLLNKATGNVNSLLDGVYVSKNGSVAGPWSKIADSQKLANSGSALKQSVGGKGYGPGIQAWYNQSLTVDPTNPNHVFVGLEEVYESQNGGSNWNAIAPYWNFFFPCWTPDILYPPNGTGACPQTAHTDQHSIAVGGSGSNRFLVVGNDGGVYQRPLNGHVNANGNATDWTDLNDGTMDALQYYAVGIGKIKGLHTTADGDQVDETTTADTPTVGGLPAEGAPSGVLVSGGLQDNGGSLLRPGADTMVSNFGGDGGDVLVDPNDGCNLVQEYVDLAMSVTQTCAHPNLLNPKHANAFLDSTQATTFNIAPPDIGARFIAPFVANDQNIDEWLAAGNSLWIQEKGFAIRKPSEWTKAYTLATPNLLYTALAMSGNEAIGGWCGATNCNNTGFVRGVTIGTKTGGKWSFAESALNGLPNRYIGGVAIGPDGAYYVALNGFNRTFTEGPGAGIGHVFRSTDGNNWTDISANFPDVPTNSIKALADGSLVVGSDLGVLYRSPGATTWSKLGTNLPLTVATDVELGPDHNIYAATYGRGIWRIAQPH